MSKTILLGKIIGAHGVRGLVKIRPYGDDPSLLEAVSEPKIKIKSITAKHILAEIEGVTDRDAAEEIKGTELFIDRDQLPEIEDDDTFYVEDLIGLKAVDENGDELGVVKSVENYGAGDLLDIQPPAGPSVLVPFTDDMIGDVGDIIIVKDWESFRSLNH